MLIIPKIKMPEKCEDCPCYYDGWCSALCIINDNTDSLPHEYAYSSAKKRYPECPLIEKKPGIRWLREKE